jgi:hypothetical protein
MLHLYQSSYEFPEEQAVTIVVATPKENFPAIGTVANPSMFLDGRDLFLCYETALDRRGRNAVIKFSDVIDFRVSPMNVDALPECKYPIGYWAFNEILNAEELERWKVLEPRLWMISFRDITVEVIFENVELLFISREEIAPSVTLLEFMNSQT